MVESARHLKTELDVLLLRNVRVLEDRQIAVVESR